MKEADWEEWIDRLVERLGPLVYNAWCFTASLLTVCFGLALSISGAVGVTSTAFLLSLPDQMLLEQLKQSGGRVDDQRMVVVIILGVAVILLVWGFLVLKDWRQQRSLAALLNRLPKNQASRVAELESLLVEAETELREVESELAGLAEEKEWARDLLAAVERVFKIPGVLEAARKIARKALHPDAHPGASESEIHDLTERFKAADAVFDHFAA